MEYLILNLYKCFSTVSVCREHGLNKYSQFLHQFLGLGSGLVYKSAIVVISVHFSKYGPLAFGLTSAGGAVGNMVFPWISSALLFEFGWRGIRQ